MTSAERKVRERYDEATCRKVRGEGRFVVGGYGEDNRWRTLAYGVTRAEAWNKAASRLLVEAIEERSGMLTRGIVMSRAVNVVSRIPQQKEGTDR